jgi:arginase
MQLQVISVPYRYDEPNEGLGLGPSALLEAGLEAKLEEAGHQVAGMSTAQLDSVDREEGRTAINIGKLGASTAEHVAAARRAGRGALVIAGDDTAAVGVIAGLQVAEGAGAAIGIVWLDAHGDFNTPETSYSGILAGMPLAIIAGLAGPHWRHAAGQAAPVPTDRILLAGVRELDEQEESLLRSTSVHLVTAKELSEHDRFEDEIDRLATKCSLLVLHVDLDVLDPHLIPSSISPSAGGLEVAGAAAVMKQTLATNKVAVVNIASLNPGAAQRGQQSIQSTVSLIEQSLADWRSVPQSARDCVTAEEQ